MKKRILIPLLLICLLSAPVPRAGAEKAVNPRMEHIQQTVQWRNRHTFLFFADSTAVSLTVKCVKTPTLSDPGKFTVTVNNGGDSDWSFEYGVSDRERDPGGYIYFSRETESKVFQDLTFCTAGTYRLYVFLYRDGDTEEAVTWQTCDFTVAEDENYQTLEEKAQEIVNECAAEGDDWQTALNLHDWLTSHTYYDTDFEYYGADVLFRGKGVCDSYSKAYKLLCNTAGITAERVRSVAQSHAWNVIKLGDEWYQVDVTWDDPIGENEAVTGLERHDYFCLDDETLYMDHIREDASFDPGCHSMDASYVVKTGGWQRYGTAFPDMTDETAYIRETLAGGETRLELAAWDAYYDYTDEEGTDVGHTMSAVNMATYAAGLERLSWDLAGGEEVRISAVYLPDDETLVIRLAGWWGVKETGTLTVPGEEIGAEAFAAVKATTLVLQDGCTAIGEGAFRDSGIRTVYIPDSVETIAEDAFDGCLRILFIPDSENEAVREYAEAHGDLVAD